MKKILIVNKSFQLGGVQVALNNMLHALNGLYDIDVLVFHNQGPKKEHLHPNIRILTPCFFVQVLGMSFSECLHKNIFYLFVKCLFAGWSKLFGNDLPIWFALLFQRRLTGYDVAIAYHHEATDKTTVSGFARFILKACDARVRIGWIHCDYRHVKYNKRQLLRVYSQLDRLVCVSKAAMDSFTGCFPELKKKCVYCYNFHNTDEILRKAQAPAEGLQKDCEGLTLVSVCRLSPEKGLPRAIDAMERIVAEHGRVRLYIVGDGPLRGELSASIEQKNLQSHVVLLGYKDNPYPYIKNADYLLISSVHEAAPVVLDEAMILHTPVIGCDIPVVREKLTDQTGIVCGSSADGVYRGIKLAAKRAECGYRYAFSDAYSEAERLAVLERIFSAE